MGGFPPARIILVIFAFVLLAVPLLRLTSGSPVAAVVPPDPNAVALTPAWIEIRFSQAPEKLVLRESFNQRVLAEIPAGSTSPWTGNTDVRIVENRAELQLLGEWSGGDASRSVAVSITPDEKETVEQTVWTETAQMSEILPFRWP